MLRVNQLINRYRPPLSQLSQLNPQQPSRFYTSPNKLPFRKWIYSSSFLLTATFSGIIYLASVKDSVRDQLVISIPSVPWDTFIDLLQPLLNKDLSGAPFNPQLPDVNHLNTPKDRIDSSHSRSEEKVPNDQTTKLPNKHPNPSIQSLQQGLTSLNVHFTALLKTSPELTPSIRKIQSILKLAHTDLTEIQHQLDLLTDSQAETVNAIVKQKDVEHVQKLTDLESSFQHQLHQLDTELKRAKETELAHLSAEFHAQAADMQAQWEFITNQRLQAHGEQLKRAWEYDLQDRLDTERHGRLARLNELDLKLMYLEQMAVSYASHITASHNIQALDNTLHALNQYIFNQKKVPFHKEWDLVRTLSQESPFITTVLDTVPKSVQNAGIPMLADLHARFSLSLVNEIRQAAQLSNEYPGMRGIIAQCQTVAQSVSSLVNQFITGQSPVALTPPKSEPVDNLHIPSNALEVPPPIGFVSYTAAKLLSMFTISKVPGLYLENDIESVLARTEFYLQAHDLDSAARELNTHLHGWARIVAKDWLNQARTYLQVKMALNVVQTHVQIMQVMGENR